MVIHPNLTSGILATHAIGLNTIRCINNEVKYNYTAHTFRLNAIAKQSMLETKFGSPLSNFFKNNKIQNS